MPTQSKSHQDANPLIGQAVLPYLLTAREVCALLKLDKRSFYRELAAGRIPKPVPVGERRTRWRSDQLRAWLDSLGS